MFTVPSPISTWFAQFKLYLLLVAAIALAAGGAYLTYRLMKADNIKLQNERDSARQSATNEKAAKNKLQENFDASEEQARLRGIRLAQLQRKLEASEADRIALANRDPAAKDWYGTLIPTTVRELRRHNAGCPLDLLLPCPNDEPHSDAGAKPAGSNEWGPDRGNGSLAWRPTILQFRQGSRYGLDSQGAIKEVATVEVLDSRAKLPSLPKEPKR